MNPANNGFDIEACVRGFISKNLLYTGEDFPYSDDSSFMQEGIVDSLGILQLVEFVQKDFGLKVDQQEVTPDNFDSVRKLGNYIRQKREKAQKV